VTPAPESLGQVKFGLIPQTLFRMNQALISDHDDVVVNRFSQAHVEHQVPMQMAMSADNGPTPLEMSGVCYIFRNSTCFEIRRNLFFFLKEFIHLLFFQDSERHHHSDGTVDNGKSLELIHRY
jgi:hypothetical protein